MFKKIINESTFKSRGFIGLINKNKYNLVKKPIPQCYHQFEWIFPIHPEYSEILKQHPSLNIGCICKCTKCNEVTSST